MGPVRTAPVVLLTLNGGLNGVEWDEAKIPAVRELMAQNLLGMFPCLRLRLIPRDAPGRNAASRSSA